MSPPPRHARQEIPLLVAVVEPTASPAKVSISLSNRTAHPETFWMSGLAQKVGITLDGNTNYTVELVVAADADAVEVRGGDPHGELLASLALRSKPTPEVVPW